MPLGSIMFPNYFCSFVRFLYCLLIWTCVKGYVFPRKNGFADDNLIPKFRPPLAENCNLPDISTQEVKDAFTFARDEERQRMNDEDNFIKSSYSLNPSDVTVAARIQGNTENKSMEQHRTQLMFEDATRYLAKLKNLPVNQLKYLRNLQLPKDEPVVIRCQKLKETTPCEVNAKYRTADGSCNNLQNPNWGSSYSCYSRMMNEKYDDGISSPRMSSSKSCLPSPRLLSTTIGDDVNVTSTRFTHMVVTFGQFLAHDMAQTSTSLAGDNGVLYKCCPRNSSIVFPSSCFPIDIPEDDYFYSSLSPTQTCMNFVRSSACSADCKLGSPRRHVNQQTGFIDASTVYGNTDENTKALRTTDPDFPGELSILSSKNGPLLPATTHPEIDQCSKFMSGGCSCFQSALVTGICRRLFDVWRNGRDLDLKNLSVLDYVSANSDYKDHGDSRVNAQPGLTAIHTNWLILHNTIAKSLALSSPNKTDEYLFQESRRIVGALMQVVTYKEFLPLVIGDKLMDFYNLKVMQSGYSKYDSAVNPTPFTENNAGPQRFGHSMIQSFFKQFTEDGVAQEDISLIDTLLHPVDICQGRRDNITRGLFQQGAQEFDRYFSESLTNHLGQLPNTKSGVDLLSINIQRGRDQGMPTYIELLEFCYEMKITNFSDLGTVMSTENWNRLQNIYTSVKDIDAYPGGFSETPRGTTMIGPTFACIVGKQFQNLKFGDRYFFEHGKQSGSFSTGQLNELRKTSLAKIICETSDSITKITPNVFLPMSAQNKLTYCKDIPGLNFTYWYNM